MNGRGDVFTLVTAQLSGFLALLLLFAGTHKWLQRARTVSAVRSLARIPAESAGVLASAVAIGEITAGLLLVTSVTQFWGALFALCLWSVYLVLIARAISQGRAAQDCNCSFAARHRPLGRFHIWRNTALIGVAGAVMFAHGPGTGLWMPQSLLASLGLFVLYCTLDMAMTFDQRRGAEPA